MDELQNALSLRQGAFTATSKGSDRSPDAAQDADLGSIFRLCARSLHASKCLNLRSPFTTHRQRYDPHAPLEPSSSKLLHNWVMPLATGLICRVVVTAALLIVCVVGILLYPEPLYGHHVDQGRLRLYSDRSFDADKGRALLNDVERRLQAAPVELRDPVSVYRIFVTNAEWRRRLVFLWVYGAGGVNYYPIAHSVFLRQGDVNTDRLFQTDGAPVAAPRTLSYFAAHEIGHSLIGKRTGAVANWRLPAWIREGMADYIAFGGDVDIPALTKELLEGHRELDPKRSGFYARYRLAVAYLLTRERWSVDKVFRTQQPSTEVEQRLVGASPQ